LQEDYIGNTRVYNHDRLSSLLKCNVMISNYNRNKGISNYINNLHIYKYTIQYEVKDRCL